MGKYDNFSMNHTNRMMKNTGYAPGNVTMSRDKHGPVSTAAPNKTVQNTPRKLSLEQSISAPAAAGTVSSMLANATTPLTYGMNMIPGIAAGLGTYFMGTDTGRGVVGPQLQMDGNMPTESAKTWGNAPKYQDGGVQESNVPEYDPTFPLTLDKKPSYDLSTYQNAIARDSTAIADRGWLARFLDDGFDQSSPTYRLQINREYRDKLTNK